MFQMTALLSQRLNTKKFMEASSIIPELSERGEPVFPGQGVYCLYLWTHFKYESSNSHNLAHYLLVVKGTVQPKKRYRPEPLAL